MRPSFSGDTFLPPLTFSIITKSSLPPSSAGMGSKLSIPKLMLNSAMSSKIGLTPILATSPVTCAIPIGPVNPGFSPGKSWSGYHQKLN